MIFFPGEWICISRYLNRELGPGVLSSAANPSVLPSQVVYFSDNKAYVAKVWKTSFSLFQRGYRPGLQRKQPVPTCQFSFIPEFPLYSSFAVKSHWLQSPRFSGILSTRYPSTRGKNNNDSKYPALWSIPKYPIGKAVSCIIGVDFISSGHG